MTLLSRTALMIAIVLTAGFLLGFQDRVVSDDLWKEATKNKTRNVNGDKPAFSYRQISTQDFQKNDLITVIVQEQTTAETDATTEREKETEWQAELAEFIRLTTEGNNNLDLQQALQGTTPGIDLQSEYESDSEGNTTRESEFTARLTAKVVQVQPNGNLVLEAQKTRTINGEREQLEFSGVVRPEDVNKDNTVQSNKIADAYISVTGNGTVSDINRRGILSRVLDFMWPF